MRKTPAARELWASGYPELSEGFPGLLGAVTSRAEALVLRLSAIYSLLDCKGEIGPEHLTAAAAVWDFCEQSARSARSPLEGPGWQTIK